MTPISMMARALLIGRNIGACQVGMAGAKTKVTMLSTRHGSSRAGSKSPAANWIPATITLVSCHALSGRAEDQGGYRFANYKEDANRINIETQSGYFELKPKSWLTLQGEVVYDAISGMTPTGSPPPSTITFVPDPNGNPPPGANSTSVPLSHMYDIRWAGSLSGTFAYKQHRLTPQFSYGEEHDYKATGAALNYSVDLNEKNTTINAGWSHNWDQVLPNGFLHQQMSKGANDLILGVNQLLGPKTVLTLNGAYGHADGYLNDQYKGVLFDNEPQGDPLSPALEPENRPQTRNKYVAYLSLTQDVTPLDASVEGTYRFFYDSYAIQAHMFQVGWFQKLGKTVVISPMARYYYQSAASFYVVRLPDYDTRPTYYSADYRLSKLDTLTLGVNVSWKLKEWLSIDAGYRRYVMNGLDGITSSTAYPKANVYSMGARIWF